MIRGEPFSWGFYTSNMSTGNPPAQGSYGTNFTAGASNVDGTSVSVLSALAQDVHYLTIAVSSTALAASDTSSLLDILIDPAGGTSWASFIDDLVCGYGNEITINGKGATVIYHFPIYIKAGSSVGVRCRTSHTVDVTTPRVTIHAFGRPSRPEMWWCGQKVESLGINAGTSKGTPVTPGNAADGSWTTIGTSTKRYGAVCLGLNGTDATALAVGYYWRLGYGSTQLPGSPVFFASTDTSENVQRIGGSQIIWCDVPSGTTWQAMGRGSAVPEDWNVSIYGVY